MRWLPREELLTFEEIERIAGVFVARFAVDGIRLTGGEPTVRAHLPVLVAKLARLRRPDGTVPDLSITTNGATFGLLAHELRDAGLARVNISLDSLQRDRFREMTRRDELARVLDGIASAQEAGFSPVKINVVLQRGVNDDEVVDFATFGRERGVVVRFIEFMPLDASGAWRSESVVGQDEIVAAIDAVYPLEAIGARGAEPASRWRYADGRGEVGVIPSVTKPFCGDCDRVRLTAEGMFRTCLFETREFDLRAIVRGGGSDDDLAVEIERAVGTKWAGHAIGKVNFIRPSRSMSQIGG
jgi:cyclic pyranopterin phosphate synthase